MSRVFSVQADDFRESELLVSYDVANTRKSQRIIPTLMKSGLQSNNATFRSVQQNGPHEGVLEGHASRIRIL
jgi:hypothetical protein